MKIIVVEDNPVILKLLKLKLESANFEVLDCENGKEAIEKFYDFKPDLLITDLLMPFTSGTELISHLRNELKSTIPIIAISSISIENTIIDTFNLGADDYVQKPLRMNEVVIRAKRLLQQKMLTT